MTTAMSTVNQIFNWNRFKATVRKEIALNGRKLGLSILVIYLFYAVLLFGINLSNHGMKNFDIGPLFAFMIIGLFASMGFSELTTKSQRSDYLTMPASTAEKFIVNTLIYVIGGIVAVIACICLADLTRIALLWSRAGDDFLVPGFTALFDIAAKWVYPFFNDKAFFPQFLLNCLWYASVFMLGSILWPKRSFLKMMIVVFVYWIIMRFFLVDLMWNDSIMQADIRYGIDGYGLIMISIDCIAIILCWVGGWLLFKKKDVITRKFWK